jgi:hypothetical protein
VVDVVVEYGGQQIMGGGDGMDVTVKWRLMSSSARPGA